MRTDLECQTVMNHLEAVRQEASTRRMLRDRAGVNLWARLLPLLRRLEAWTERHAGEAPHPALQTRATGTR